MKTCTTLQTRLMRTGDWMRRNRTIIRYIQFIVLLIYITLIFVPILLPLPDETTRIWSHLTSIAQFCFWGIWWPFVLISMVVMGRIWCGILCPEGVVTELASKYGQAKSIPRWMRWQGWPFLAFVLTTIYGQMISVYQYPKAVFVILGGSTILSIAIGYLYGREKRVWCKYLCPVNGVFNLLAKLSPFYYKVDENAWRASYNTHKISINCAPLLPLRNMQGASDCHMCGRCSSYRNAISLTWRTPGQEIIEIGRSKNNIWESILILYGLFGIAIGAFHWNASPWFIQIKQCIAEWLIDHNIMWPFNTNAPWWLLTNYPQQNDVFSWLDGSIIVLYITVTGAIIGTVLALIFVMMTLLLGKWQYSRFNHLIQTTIPLATGGIFIGLSATTVNLLRSEHILLLWINHLRCILLTGMTLWSLGLSWKIISQQTQVISKRLLAIFLMIIAMMLANIAWLLLFWIW